MRDEKRIRSSKGVDRVSAPTRRRFMSTTGAIIAGTVLNKIKVAIGAEPYLGLPLTLVDAAKKEGEVTPYEPFPTAQSKPMADGFTREFGIPNKFFRAGQEKLQTRLEAEIRAGRIIADTIGQSDLDIVQSMMDRGLVDLSRPSLWDQYPTRFHLPQYDNIPFATLSCNMIYNTKLVAAADAPRTWQDLVSPRWKGKVVIPSPEYAGTGFALLAEWVKLYGWEFIHALRKNQTFVVQAVSASDTRVTSGQSYVGIANSHRGSVLLGEGAPFAFVWSKKTPAVALSYIHVVMKKAPHIAAGRLYRDYCLTLEVQNQQAKVGLWSAHPKAMQPANIPPLNEAPLVTLDWKYIKTHRASLMQGWKSIMT